MLERRGSAEERRSRVCLGLLPLAHGVDDGFPPKTPMPVMHKSLHGPTVVFWLACPAVFRGWVRLQALTSLTSRFELDSR